MFIESGGSIYESSKEWVAFKGSDPSALAIQFKLKFFKNLEDVTFPSCNNPKNFSSPLDINSTSMGSSKQKIRKFMSISPFIANFLDLSPSMELSDIFVHCLDAANSFNVKPNMLNGFTKNYEEKRDLIKLMWAESMGKVTTTIYIDSLDPDVM